jgi:hypothetical protein
MQGSTVNLNDIKSDMMVKWLYEQQLRKHYASGQDAFEGAVLKKGRGNFTCCPPQMSLIPNSLYEMVTHMNVRCAMTINTPVVRAIMGSMRRAAADLDYVPLPEGLRVQIIRTMADLPRCKLHHFAAFVEDIGMLVVWDDEAEQLLQRAVFLEAQLVLIIWGNGEEDSYETSDEKPGHIHAVDLDPAQLEEALAREHRPVMLWSAAMVMCTLALLIACIGLGWRWLVLEIMVDKNYIRLAFLAVAPLQVFVSLVSLPHTSFPMGLGYLVTNTHQVLLPSAHRQPLPDFRPHISGQLQQQVLLGKASPSPQLQYSHFATCLHSNACLQGRSRRRHHAHRRVSEASH